MCLFCAKCIGTLEGRWHSPSQVQGQAQEERPWRVGGGQGWSWGLGLLFSCRALKLSLQRLKEGRATAVSWDSDGRGFLMRLNLNPYKKALK